MSVFIIAEIGSNHGGSLERALALIDAAADAGADAAKFQRFRVDKFLVPRENPEALRRYELPDEWLPKLKASCDGRGIEFMCTAFDLESLDVIDPYVKRHKVGSYEVPKSKYVEAVAAKGKPMLLSNGVLLPGEHWHGPNTTMLRCVSKYPAPIGGYLKILPDAPWGVSDHTLHPTIVPAAAVALGACVVEKHLRLELVPFAHIAEVTGASLMWERTPDSEHSIGQRAFAQLVEAVRLTESAVRG